MHYRIVKIERFSLLNSCVIILTGLVSTVAAVFLDECLYNWPA